MLVRRGARAASMVRHLANGQATTAFGTVDTSTRNGEVAKEVESLKHSLPYAHMRTGDFCQVAPQLHNPFTDDPILERILRKIMPKKEYDEVTADLHRFGERIVHEIDALGRRAELEPPQLEQLDAWGNRVDNLIVSPAWNRLKEICAEEGVVALGYDESKHPVWRRIHQIAKLYLFAPSAGLVTCPMAMSDGAAKTFKELGLLETSKEAKEAFNRLISRDPSVAWTSGQWMTEKRGGSDVGGGCDTYAVHHSGNNYTLNGYKWFSSAVDADVALTLARIVDKNGRAMQGSKGLSLFYVRLRDETTKKLNGIQMVKLKNKLGTKQLPTAEIILDGTKAIKLSEEGRGVASIANMLNITRIHNTVSAIGFVRRIISLARDYATRRVVFGRLQVDWPLHLLSLSKLEVETRGCMMLMFEVARLLGLQESGKANENEATMLRLLTPVAKMYTGKKSVPMISECLECFGGQGYIEDTGIPTLLRDAQVLPIWEGTTNVLALDVLRVFNAKKNTLDGFRDTINELISHANEDKATEITECKGAIKSALYVLEHTLKLLTSKNLKQPMQIERAAREISFAIARIYAGALLTSLAGDEVGTKSDISTAYRFCVEEKLTNVNTDEFVSERTEDDRNIIFENFEPLSKI